MPERTEHGQERHAQGDRPTKEAFRDRENPKEVYVDLENGNNIYIGANGRTHIFTSEGKHHTSFRTTSHERRGKILIGRWQRVYDQV